MLLEEAKVGMNPQTSTHGHQAKHSKLVINLVGFLFLTKLIMTFFFYVKLIKTL